MKRLIEVHVAGIKWLSRRASALTLCLPASLCLSLPYSLYPVFPSFNSYRLTPSSVHSSLSVVITLSRDVGTVQGVNQSSHRNQLPVAGTLQNDLVPGNIAPKIYLRKLVATVDVAFVVVVFAQFISPQIVVQLQLQLCVTGCGREYPPLYAPLTTSAYVIQWNECFIGLMELTRGSHWMQDGGGWTERTLSPGYSKVYRNEKGQFNLICPSADMQKGCAQNAAIIHTCGQAETHKHTHTQHVLHMWRGGQKGGASAAEA